jgi:hypothetical protein
MTGGYLCYIVNVKTTEYIVGLDNMKNKTQGVGPKGQAIQ